MDSKVVRRRQRLYRYAVDLFIKLLEQVTGRKRVDYRCNDADVACWDVFMNVFGDGIGEEFIRKFAEYGFQSWFNSGSEINRSHSIRFNWVFGMAAIRRWKKYSAETNVYLTRIGLKKEHEINLVGRTGEIANIVTTLRSSEEKYKQVYHNTKRGLLWCIANTTLYFHKSQWCATCEFKKECREVLRKEYPKIYMKRGYGK